MNEKTPYAKDSVEKTVRDIRRRTRRKFSAEEKIRIVLEGLRGEDSIAELCRKEGINQNLYYRWSKDFLEAGKKRLSGDTAREANTDEVKSLRHEATGLKEAVAELLMENRLLKKSVSTWVKAHKKEEPRLVPLPPQLFQSKLQPLSPPHLQLRIQLKL